MKNGKYCNGKKSLNMKPLAVLLALTLLVGCAIGGTIAWLTAQTGEVVNTFTVGDININLTEDSGNEFKIVPGGEDVKDPRITVLKKSEDCYVYAYVENNVLLSNVEVVIPVINGKTDTVAGWELVTSNNHKYLYRYSAVVEYNENDDQQLVDVFSKVTYSPEITKSDITTLANKTIVIKGFAHQSENLGETEAAAIALADTAAKTHFGLA